MTETNQLRFGLIGAGMMGREHLRNLALISGSTVTAIADPDSGSQKSAVETTNDEPTVFHDIDALLDADLVDALVIAAPNDTHKRLLERIFARAKPIPILCEKPFCTSAEDVKWLASAAKGYGAPIWVGMEYRYMPAMQLFRQQVQTDIVGRKWMFAIREHRHPFLPKVGDWNRFSRRTGGTLVEKCCHFFDLMRLIVGDEPIRVYASGAMDVNHLDERYDGQTPDIIDNAFVVVDFRNGVRAALDLCMFADGAKWEAEYTLTGDRARIDCMIPSRRAYGAGTQAEVLITTRDATLPERLPVTVDPAVMGAGAHSGATYYEHLAFRRAITEGGPLEVGPEEGLKAVVMGLAAELSAREKRVVTIDGLEFG